MHARPLRRVKANDVKGSNLEAFGNSRECYLLENSCALIEKEKMKVDMVFCVRILKVRLLVTEIRKSMKTSCYIIVIIFVQHQIS